MPALFQKFAIAFHYPENWSLDEQATAQGQHEVTVYNPSGGGFWSVGIHPRGTEPQRLAAAALTAMKEEYDNLDSEAVQETLFGQDVVGYDINFYCLDLTNTAIVRSIRTSRATYTVFYQAEDREFDAIQPVFDAITLSFLKSLSHQE